MSTIFVGIRLYARYKSFKKLFWDDVFDLFAWLLSLLAAIDWQVVSGRMYQFIAITSGQLWPPPQNFVSETEQYYKGSLVALLFFYTSLWSVKFSFLIFFRCLGQNIRAQKIHWWIVFTCTVVTYIACFADTQYWCLVSPLQELFRKCSTDASHRWILYTLDFNCAFDIVTDVLSKLITTCFSHRDSNILVLSIPIVLMWKVRISLRKKVALMAIFSLVIITIVFAIARVAVISSQTEADGTRLPDTSWSYMWSSIEQNIGESLSTTESDKKLIC